MITTNTAPPGFVWVFDQRHANWGTALNFRIHSMGRCVEPKDAAPYVASQQRTTYKGNPSDFTCAFCRVRHVLLGVESAQEALALRRETTMGLAVIEPFVIAPDRGGCDCMSGYEHQLRGCQATVKRGADDPRHTVAMRLMSVRELTKEREAKDASMYVGALTEATPAETTLPLSTPAAVAPPESEVVYEVSLPLPTFERAVKSLDNQYLEEEL